MNSIEERKRESAVTGRVKIYGTFGPACRDLNTLKGMFREGMTGMRLNLSHTTLEDSAQLLEVYHKAARECGIMPELLIDMQGPELRIGDLKEPVKLTAGELIKLEEIPFPKTAADALTYQSTNRCFGQEILLDDGKILLTLEDKGSDAGVLLRVVRGGLLQSRKSAALPGCGFRLPAMTENDRKQIANAKAYGVTAVMQPFVRGKEDLIEVRNALDQSNCKDIRLFAKIENKEGIGKLKELIPHCDEIVIARGDLGNAMELWELPKAQKRISAFCREEGRDFMVVTQMLESMLHRQVPARAEVSDIFNAVLDGAASVMVTGETAVGEFPVLVIRYLARTVREAEEYLNDRL